MLGGPSFIIVAYIELTRANCVKIEGLGHILPYFPLRFQYNFVPLCRGKDKRAT